MPYQIGSGMTDTELNAASWWVKHRLGLRRAGYGALIALCVLFWGYTLWSYTDAYLISWPRESRIPRLIAQQAVPPEALRAIAPEPLQPGDALAFETTDGRLDLYSTVNNTNALWSARITYHFLIDSQKTPNKEVVVLPHSVRPVTELGWRGAGSPQLEIESVTWERIPLTKVAGDYDAFAAAHQDFIIEEPPVYISIGSGSGKTDFVIENKTGYGYWNVSLYVTLLRQGLPLAVNKVDLREFKPNEKRPVSLQWLEAVSGVDQVEVTPYVDLLDPASYLPSDRL